MPEFLNLYYFCNGSENRTVEYLSSVYSDKDRLAEVIEEITKEHLNAKTIKGKSVLLKPNWVKHSSKTEDELCLRTNDNFLLSTLTYILKNSPSKVIIADAPIQRCDWKKMLSITFLAELKKLSYQFNIPVEVIDFRRQIINTRQGNVLTEVRPLSDYVIVDTGEKSYLEPVSLPNENRFRVTCYDPDRMREAHTQGIHKYCIAKEFFEADVVISLPKIKTHEKTCITGALKNLVGINGDKDFLPHHRIGGTQRGGDCYPGKSILRYWAELALDRANHRQQSVGSRYWRYLSAILWRLSIPSSEHQLAAGWYGNDTVWRMVLDLNLIAEYGKSDGLISTHKQRQIFSLCDAVIAGQGDGPLRPKPLPLGFISFTDNSPLNDWIMAILMGFNPDKIPILKKTGLSSQGKKITLNGEDIEMEELARHTQYALPPTGWIKYLNFCQ